MWIYRLYTWRIWPRACRALVEVSGLVFTNGSKITPFYCRSESIVIRDENYSYTSWPMTFWPYEVVSIYGMSFSGIPPAHYLRILHSADSLLFICSISPSVHVHQICLHPNPFRMKLLYYKPFGDRPSAVTRVFVARGVTVWLMNMLASLLMISPYFHASYSFLFVWRFVLSFFLGIGLVIIDLEPPYWMTTGIRMSRKKNLDLDTETIIGPIQYVYNSPSLTVANRKGVF